MRILFIGCVESSYRLLKALLERGCGVVGVVTKEKSKFNADYCDLRPLCHQYDISYICVKNINDTDAGEYIRSCDPDIGFCFGWSQLVGEEVMGLFPQGIVGFHPAALPNNRGRHPLIWALALGLSETASSFFIMDASADTGDIVSQRTVSIDYSDDARSLYDKVLDTAVEQELELVGAFTSGTLERIPQKEGAGNSWRKRGKLDGQIDWRMSSRSIYNLVRALTHPYAGAHFVYEGREHKVWKAEEITSQGLENVEPGKVLASDGTVMDVKVGEGAIRLLEFDGAAIGEGEYIL